MKIRSIVQAPKGYVLLSCDLSQAESWIVAYLSRDERMKHALLYDDIHSVTARAIFSLPDNQKPTDEQRYVGKRVNHATSYRMQPDKFTEVYNKDSPTSISVAQSRKYQTAWHGLYTRIKVWWGEIEVELRENDGWLVTPYDRAVQFLGPQQGELLRDATAFKPQSTVADHFNGKEQPFNPIPGGLKKLYSTIPTECQIINQSHDSCIIETPFAIWKEVYEIAKECLYRPIIIYGEECKIPVDGKVGERWEEGMEKIK